MTKPSGILFSSNCHHRELWDGNFVNMSKLRRDYYYKLYLTIINQKWCNSLMKFVIGLYLRKGENWIILDTWWMSMFLTLSHQIIQKWSLRSLNDQFSLVNINFWQTLCNERPERRLLPKGNLSPGQNKYLKRQVWCWVPELVLKIWVFSVFVECSLSGKCGNWL